MLQNLLNWRIHIIFLGRSVFASKEYSDISGIFSKNVWSENFKLALYKKYFPLRIFILNVRYNQKILDLLLLFYKFLKALRQLSQKVWPKILTPYFFNSNLYLTFLRSCFENIFKIVCINKTQNLPYCSSLQSVVIYNFNEMESTFPVPFRDYVTDCYGSVAWFMVSICLMGKGK